MSKPTVSRSKRSILLKIGSKPGHVVVKVSRVRFFYNMDVPISSCKELYQVFLSCNFSVRFKRHNPISHGRDRADFPGVGAPPLSSSQEPKVTGKPTSIGLPLLYSLKNVLHVQWCHHVELSNLMNLLFLTSIHP